LDLRNLKLEAVAKKANRSISMVSLVIRGVKNSANVEAALAKMLGFATYKDLMDTASLASKGVAV
jgi:hypothetical protein